MKVHSYEDRLSIALELTQDSARHLPKGFSCHTCIIEVDRSPTTEYPLTSDTAFPLPSNASGNMLALS